MLFFNLFIVFIEREQSLRSKRYSKRILSRLVVLMLLFFVATTSHLCWILRKTFLLLFVLYDTVFIDISGLKSNLD